MPVDTLHPEYSKYAPIWQECDDALSGQRVIRAAGERYLPKTSGMESHKNSKAYDAYRSRARFFDVPAESLEGMMGVFDFPISDELVTNNGLSVRQLAREVARAVYAKGRHILVVEANGANPYLVQYAAESLINWKVDENDKLALAVFRESVLSDDEFEHESCGEYQYRVYRPNGVTLYDDEGNELDFYPANYPQLPVIIIGAVDCSSSCDRPPVQRIVECALSAYRKSADYEQAMYLTAQATPWVSNVGQAEYEQICSAGIGAGALWHLGENGGQAGYLEFTGAGIGAIKQAIEDELSKAAEYAVRLTQTTGVESAKAKSIRDAAQKSALATMADSISIGINLALEIRARWGGLEYEPYIIAVQDAEQAEATMIAAIGNRVNAGGYPNEVEYNYAVKSGLFNGSLDEWNDKRVTGL